MWAAATPGLIAWAAVIAVPLGWLFASAVGQAGVGVSDLHLGLKALKTLGLSAAVATLAVVLGYVPGQLLGTARRGQGVLLGLLLAPLLLPQYLICYCWSAVRSETTPLGAWLAATPAGRQWADAAAMATAMAAMVLWYWPLAALLMAQGWRNLDAETLGASRMDAGRWGRLTGVVWPLLRRPVMLAFVVCLVWSLSESATFHVVIMTTLGTDLAQAYARTGSEAAVTRAAWPVMLAAAGAGVLLWRRARDWSYRPALDRPKPVGGAWRWGVFAALVGLSLAAPVILLGVYSRGLDAVWTMFVAVRGRLGISALAAAIGAAGAIGIALSALLIDGCGRVGRAVSAVMQPVIFLAMFLPGATVGAALVRSQAAVRAATGVDVGWAMVSVGLAARFAGLALVMLMLARDSHGRRLAEMASLDGASWWRAWRWIHLPRLWLLPAAAMALLVMMGITELPATSLLAAPGVGSFSSWLFDQMHYLRDRDAMAASMVLMGAYFCVVAAAATLLWLFSKSRIAPTAILCLVAIGVAGCESASTEYAHVEAVIGQTGRGDGEFMYPRAVDRAGDGTVFVIDKTGRIQRFSSDGEYLGEYQMPEIADGKPTGITFGPDGLLYVADTHYHRVAAFNADGEIVKSFGEFGEGDGQFIFPTDVAFGPDGRMYVSEYGGNDRVSIFDPDGAFRGAFGSAGDGDGQFTRPAALAVDARRGRLYVADAANHRIGVYDLDGRLIGYIGSVGSGPGQLRYPYDMVLADDGSLVVCEFGNNRIQRFDPEGRSTGVWGTAGRSVGQLAYPWGVTLDADGRAVIVDAGNNRLQIWRL